MIAVVFALPRNEDLADALSVQLGAERGAIELRHFPDGETYVRLHTDVAGRDVIFAASLDVPDGKLAPLLFSARTARALGATSVVLAAPYLAYMRQDRQFHPGEGITARYFADFVSSFADALVTVDPHLHRIHALSEIYSIPAEGVHAAPLIGEWLRENVSSPVLIGPDEESRQWVAAVAESADAPHLVLAKVRHGDRDVEVSVPDIDRWRERTPVLVDDIVSTGRTMIEAIKHLRATTPRPPLCVAVHAVFSNTAYDDIVAAGAGRVVTCNTIEHASNAIDVMPAVARAMGDLYAAGAPQCAALRRTRPSAAPIASDTAS